jgi:hypothetical protein
MVAVGAPAAGLTIVAATLALAADPARAAPTDPGLGLEAVTSAVGLGGTDQAATGNAGVANGNSGALPLQLPLNLSCNAVGVLGVGLGACAPAADPPPVPPTGPPTGPPAGGPPPSRSGPPDESLPDTGTPVGLLSGLGGLLAAGGAALRVAAGYPGRGYTGRHRGDA